MRVNVPTAVAAALLFLLGYFYGAQKDAMQTSNCQASEKSTATLTKTIALAPTQARYVFTQENGCLRLVYAPRFPVLVRGSIVEISGKQETPEDAFSGIPEYAEFLRDENVSFVVKNAEVKILQKKDVYIDTFRVRIASLLTTLFREPDSSLLVAMLTGDQGGIGKEIKDVYRNSGITHILSISGLHVSIIAIVLTVCISIFQIPGFIRSILIFSLLWVYIASVGFPASAVRAGVFWTLYVLAYHVRALTGTLTVIFLTLAVLLTSSPRIINTIGFQLSVTAVCGIGIAIFFTRRIRVAPYLKAIFTLCAVSFGATLTTAPLTLYYFGTVSLVGIITNIVVIPLLPLVTYAVLIALVLQAFAFPFALMIAFVVHLLLAWILFVARLCASIPYGHFENILFPLWGIGLYYAVLMLGIIVIMKWHKISWRQWWI
ncbi:MAG: ComEC/Rec2 family competence protein [bacterium]|nr:ComEC/Rec2 family competence protein [bacterium]